MASIHPVADFHTHSLVSPHAYSTLTENAAAAAKAGMLAMASTDHGEATPDFAHHWHFSNMGILPPYLEGVRLLRGIEANVMDFDGTLATDSCRLQQMDLVIASMHTGIMKDGTPEELTRAWAAVAENPDVDIIGHPGTPRFAFDYETVIPLFGQYGKVVEINEGTFRVRGDSAENCKRIALLCKKYGVRVAVNSDAHFHAHVGQFSQAVALLREVAFPPELVINNSRKSVKAFLNEKNIVL